MITTLASLDQHVRARCQVSCPDRWAELERWPQGPLAPRGGGLSYVAASFGGDATAIDITAFDRILDVDAEGKWVRVEAGVTLGKLHAFLGPRGLCLPVQPGYPAMTVGGCVAADVHGKNHGCDGTFGRHVLELDLAHPDFGRRSLYPGDPDFALTIGGFGLTGLILSVRLATVPLPGTSLEESHVQVASIEDGVAWMKQFSGDFDLSYAWLDLSRPRDQRGHGYVTAARWASGSLPVAAAVPRCRLAPSAPDPLRRPLFNGLTMPWINRLYRWNALRRPRTTVQLESVLWPALGREGYFRFHGARGFLESQVLIPADAMDGYLAAWRACQRTHGVPIILATLKAFSGGTQDLLRYDGDGISFTIDVANTAEGRQFLAALDGLNAEAGAISNIMKDSRLSAAAVRAQYRDYEEFRDRLRRFDPSRRFVTALSRRLEL